MPRRPKQQRRHSERSVRVQESNSHFPFDFHRKQLRIRASRDAGRGWRICSTWTLPRRARSGKRVGVRSTTFPPPAPSLPPSPPALPRPFHPSLRLSRDPAPVLQHQTPFPPSLAPIPPRPALRTACKIDSTAKKQPKVGEIRIHSNRVSYPEATLRTSSIAYRTRHTLSSSLRFSDHRNRNPFPRKPNRLPTPGISTSSPRLPFIPHRLRLACHHRSSARRLPSPFSTLPQLPSMITTTNSTTLGCATPLARLERSNWTQTTTRQTIFSDYSPSPSMRNPSNDPFRRQFLARRMVEGLLRLMYLVRLSKWDSRSSRGNRHSSRVCDQTENGASNRHSRSWSVNRVARRNRGMRGERIVVANRRKLLRSRLDDERGKPPLSPPRGKRMMDRRKWDPARPRTKNKRPFCCLKLRN